MIKDGKIVYCPPPFEEVQNEVTKIDKDGRPLECSLHSDLSLLMRIDKLSVTAKQMETLKEQLQPLVDSSSFRADFEESFGKLTDEDLIKSCPSRYLSTASEQKSYLEYLANEDMKVRKQVAEETKKAKEKEELERQNADFENAIKSAFGY